MTTEDRGRRYPAACMSEFCGKGSESCPECRYYPPLREFKEWRDRTGAICLDPVWSPEFYVAPETCPECGARWSWSLEGERWEPPRKCSACTPVVVDERAHYRSEL